MTLPGLRFWSSGRAALVLDQPLDQLRLGQGTGWPIWKGLRAVGPAAGRPTVLAAGTLEDVLALCHQDVSARRTAAR